MTNKTLEKITEFLNRIDCPPEYILKNKLENPTRVNLMNDEMDLPQYVVINKGEDIILDDKKFRDKLSFESGNNLDLICFYTENCKSMKGFLEELRSDGYEIIFQDKLNNKKL